MDSLSGFIDFVSKTTFEMVQDPLGPPRWERILPLGDAKSANIVQLFDRFPEARVFYPFESETWWSDCAMSSKWMRELWIAGVPWAIVGSYLLFIVVGQLLLGTSSAPKGKPFNVKPVWKWWNLGLALFSVCGAARTVPHLIAELVQDGMYSTMCGPAAKRYGFGACGLWTFFFIVSKIPELGDTVFIVLGQKPLIFLHWYHHVTVLLFCWHSYVTESAAGLWFVAMNFSVHAMMYTYYCLRNFGIRLPKWIAPVVTFFQTSQMAVGVTVCTMVYYYKQIQGKSCDVDDKNWLAGLIMYASYFVLFFVLAVERYCLRPGKSSEKKTKKE